jgi:hypothetical protein
LSLSPAQIARRWFPWVGPFAAFILLLVVGDSISSDPRITYGLRLLICGGIIGIFSRKVLDLRMSAPIGSILLGVLVFVIWVLPDQLLTDYRSFWLFENGLTGEAKSSVAETYRSDLLFLILRISSTALLVPILEELFWRGFLLRQKSSSSMGTSSAVDEIRRIKNRRSER